MGMKQKKKIKNQKKFQNGRVKKTEIFKTANSRNFFAKISWIGLRISSIN
jgi:hypothetical protein